MQNAKLHGLYLITNDDPLDVLLPKLEAALGAGIALLQFRRKKTPPAQRYAEAQTILALCQRYNVSLVINDNIELAERLNCGVHLGQEDGEIADARAVLGRDAIIGCTCHASLALASHAALAGASYLAFGAVYPSGTKPDAERVHLSTLALAAQQFHQPICAIGGLSVENATAVKATGVDLFAVVGDVLNLTADRIPDRIQAWHDRLKSS
jgi:thiamine-phosphate pyrophosphorylase